MKKIHMFSNSVLGGCLLISLSVPVYADSPCDTEVLSVQAVLDSDPEGISQSDLEKATLLFKVLSEDCGGGAPFTDIEPISQQIRTLLNMEESS